jgi:hypothetical protein
MPSLAARESTGGRSGSLKKLDSAALSDMATAGGRAPDTAAVRGDRAAAGNAVDASRIMAPSLWQQCGQCRGWEWCPRNRLPAWPCGVSRVPAGPKWLSGGRGGPRQKQTGWARRREGVQASKWKSQFNHVLVKRVQKEIAKPSRKTRLKRALEVRIGRLVVLHRSSPRRFLALAGGAHARGSVPVPPCATFNTLCDASMRGRRGALMQWVDTSSVERDGKKHRWRTLS